MNEDLRIIVPGGLNTDLIGLGVERLLGSGELTLGGTFHVGPGGKARNMAQMAAEWLGSGRVAMIGKTVRDPFGLWRVPYDALQAAGVNTDHISILDFEAAGGKFPGIALIPVDASGHNQIYCLPGINKDFGPSDIQAAEAVFLSVQKPAYMMLALEIPDAAIRECIRMANRHGLRVVLDPGGIDGLGGEEGNRLGGEEVRSLGLVGVFLIKPNEFEAEILTGIQIDGFRSAGAAAQILMSQGIEYVMITHGANGAYLFGHGLAEHIPVPVVAETGVQDETGCGDQVTAVITACLAEGLPVEEAAAIAVKAGTLQFHRQGIKPVNKRDFHNF